MKKIMMAIACLLCSFVMYTGTAEAAQMKSTYTLKSGSHVYEDSITAKAGANKSVSLTVKESGTFKLRVGEYYYNNQVLKGNQQIKVQVVNTKGKAVATKYVKKSEPTYTSIKLEKGTYKLIFSTKNMKKNTTMKCNVWFSFHKDFVLKSDQKPLYDVLNIKRQTKVKWVNEKSQTVRVNAGGLYNENAKVTVRDTKGRVVFSEESGNNTPWQWHYIEKGTYEISFSGFSYIDTKFVIEKEARYNENIVTNATSKEKAVTYTGQRINFAYSNTQVKEKTQWIKVDTSKKDRVFYIDTTFQTGGDHDSVFYGAVVYKEDGTKVEMDPERAYVFLKGTGIYYVSIRTTSTSGAFIDPREVKAAVTIGGKREPIWYDGEITLIETGKKEITGTLEVVQDSYASFVLNDLEKKKTITLYDKNKQKVKVDADRNCKLKAGTYTFKTAVSGKTESYKCDINVYPIKEMKNEKMVYTSGKKLTVNLNGVKSGNIYRFVANGTLLGVSRTVTIYENGKKIASNPNECYFVAKAGKTYKAVVTTSTDRLLYYWYCDCSEFKEANKELKSTKKAAKTVTIAKNKKISKDFKVQGKTSGWIKVKSTSKKKIRFLFDGYVNDGEAIAKVYNSKGVLKSTMKLNSNNRYEGDLLPGNQTYSVKIYSTNKKTSVYTKFYVEDDVE